MREWELREKMLDLVADPPCRKCEFWDMQGHHCFLISITESTAECGLLNQILALVDIYFIDCNECFAQSVLALKELEEKLKK